MGNSYGIFSLCQFNAMVVVLWLLVVIQLRSETEGKGQLRGKHRLQESMRKSAALV
jgi:hypothetical protein